MLTGTLPEHGYYSNGSATHVVKHTCCMNALLHLKQELQIFGVVTLRVGGEGKEKAIAIRNSSKAGLNNGKGSGALVPL